MGTHLRIEENPSSLVSLNISNSAILHFLSPALLFFELGQQLVKKKLLMQARRITRLLSPSSSLPLPLLYLYLSPPRGTRSPIRTNDEGPRRFCKKAQAGGRAPVLLCATHDQ